MQTNYWQQNFGKHRQAATHASHYKQSQNAELLQLKTIYQRFAGLMCRNQYQYHMHSDVTVRPV